MGTDSERQRWVRRIATVGLLVVLLLPVARDRDGLPFSTYPMYASARSNLVTYVTVRGVGDDGVAYDLSMFTIAQTRDPLIAEAFLSDAFRRGDTDRVCTEVAGRVTEPVRWIEVANELFDVSDRSIGDAPVERTVLSRCAVAP